jgi:hypothetical protein
MVAVVVVAAVAPARAVAAVVAMPGLGLGLGLEMLAMPAAVARTRAAVGRPIMVADSPRRHPRQPPHQQRLLLLPSQVSLGGSGRPTVR